MEKRKETEKKCYHSVRKKWKRVMAMALSVLMVTSVIDYSGLINVNAQTQSDTKIITTFAELSEDIGNQQIAEGASEADINLPDTLNVTVKTFVQENVATDVESVEESIEESAEGANAVNPDETTAVNIDETTAENADGSTQDTTESETVTKEVVEEISLDNIIWKINASMSTSDTFDSTNPDTTFVYEPVLPEWYTIAEGLSLPQIKIVIIKNEEDSNGTFQESQTIDGIEITVKADAGVFPEDALLNARKIVDANEQEKIEEAVKEEVEAEEAAKTVKELISFDITITDAEGNELQPDISKGEVKVSFAKLPMVTEDNMVTQELKVFHMDDTLNKAQGLETTVNQEEGTLEAPAEHFSSYSVALLTSGAAPVTELWVGTTQVVQSGGAVTADISGTDWSYDSTTATLTLNGANITTMTKPNDPTYGAYYFGIYCYGDLNIVVTGDSTIDVKAAIDKSFGICVRGNLSVSGSAILSVTGNWRGLYVNENLILSEAVTLSGIAESTSLDTIDGVFVFNSIKVSDTANLIGIAKGGKFRTNGIQCTRGNITIDSGATLTGGLDDGFTAYNSDTNAGVTAGYTSYYGGQVLVEGTLVARAGSATEHGNVAGLNLVNVEMIISGNGSVSAESGDLGDTDSTSYGVVARGTSSIQVDAGGFFASGEKGAVYPATTSIAINGTPVYYEVSTNRDGSSATVCTDTDTWNSTYNGNFGAYKYINATTVYEVYINGIQVTRVNRHDVLGDGTVTYTPAFGESPAKLALNGASLTTVSLDGDTELILTGTSTMETVTNTGAVTLSGNGELTITGNLDCGSDSLTVESGAVLTTQGTVTAGAVVNNGTLVNEGTLILPETTTVEQIQAMNLVGDGIVKAGNKIYLNGKLYVDGGDASADGLNLSTLPIEGTYYKTGDSYALFTPATADPVANARLELHNAVISTTNTTALILPSTESVDIIVVGDSSLTAGGSGNVIATNGQPLSITGDGDLTLGGPYYGINVNGIGAVSLDITGDLTFDTDSQPIGTSGDITVSAKSITSKSGYNFYSGSGAVSLTATDGDISLTTKDSYMGAVTGNIITLTANKGAVTICHLDNADGGYAINGTAVTISALNDVNITTSRGGIYASSGEVLVTSQSGSIEMSCVMDQCVRAYGAVALEAARDIVLNNSGDYSAAIMSSSQAVDITAGGKLSSISAYGFQVGVLTIKAKEVSIAGTTQDGIQASSVSITNKDGSNCERVSITATSGSHSCAAIYSVGDVLVKADNLFICGKASAMAISATGNVTIGDAGMIAGTINVGTDNIDPRIIRTAYGGEVGTTGLDISTPPAETTVYTAGDGYILWNQTTKTLILSSAYVTGSLILPDNQLIVIYTTADSVINGNITGAGSYNIDYTFTGTALLTINGDISGFTNGDTVNMQSGAQVEVNGTISIGASGMDGILNVIGSGTALSVSASHGYAVMCGTVNVESGAFLNVSTQGIGSIGVETLTGGVNVTGGSTLTAGCDYGVYIIDGKLTVDSTSKLITNGAVAPFCIADSTSTKAQSAVLALSGIPTGTAIVSVQGSDIGYGYTYWSLIPANGTLTVTDENSTPVTLSGAKIGTLTFVKEASPSDNNDNGNGSDEDGNGSNGTNGDSGSTGGDTNTSNGTATDSNSSNSSTAGNRGGIGVRTNRKTASDVQEISNQQTDTDTHDKEPVDDGTSSTDNTDSTNQSQNTTKDDTTKTQADKETSGNMMIIWILFGIMVVVEIGGTTIYMRRKKADKEEKKA